MLDKLSNFEQNIKLEDTESNIQNMEVPRAYDPII